jgi:hypothetical protein
MKPPPEDQRPGKDESPSKSTRTEEALRTIEEYANDLKEIIKRVGKRVFH